MLCRIFIVTYSTYYIIPESANVINILGDVKVSLNVSYKQKHIPLLELFKSREIDILKTIAVSYIKTLTELFEYFFVVMWWFYR